MMNTEQRHVLHVFSVSVYFDFIFLFTFLHCTIGRRHILPIFLLLFFLEKLIPIFPPCHFQRVGKHIQAKALAKWRQNGNNQTCMRCALSFSDPNTHSSSTHRAASTATTGTPLLSTSGWNAMKRKVMAWLEPPGTTSPTPILCLSAHS